MEELKRMEADLERFERLDATLEDLPKTLRKQVHVPLCDMAFVPGTVNKTDEVFVLLGSGLFAKRSAFQAREILNRRKDLLKQSLEDLQKRLPATSKEDKPIHESPPFELRPLSEGDGDDVEVPAPVATNAPISGKEHDAVMRRLEELEALEARGSLKSLEAHEGASAETKAFTGVISERVGEKEGAAEQKTNPEIKPKRVSLFKKQRAQQSKGSS